MSFQNDTFFKTLLRMPTAYTPIWIMRQAGRYLPEYRKIREEAGSFLNLCKTPALAAEVSLQPLRRFPLDAVIVFSDILTLPDAMGLGLNFVEGEGPRFSKKISQKKDIEKLIFPDPHKDLAYVMDTLRQVKRELKNKVPLIGFAGSPFTLAAYMVEGGSSTSFTRLATMCRDYPQTLHLLLEKLTESLALYLTAQIESGADVVMIFDSWGGLLNERNYPSFSLNYIESLIKNLKKNRPGQKIPVIVFARGASKRLPQLKNLSADGLGLDQYADLREAQPLLSSRFVLQGNLDPLLLKESDTKIRQEVGRILKACAGNPHVFNLGHGISPDIDPEKVAFLIHEVHEQSKAYH